MNENEVKVFTLKEANELLPVLSDLLRDLQRKRHNVSELEVQIDSLELISGSGDQAAEKELEKLIEKHRQIVAKFYEVVDEIHSHGCLLKDVDLGLIDFYGAVEGHIVCLCWRLGEEQVRFWHEVTEGYAGREPLSEN